MARPATEGHTSNALWSFRDLVANSAIRRTGGVSTRGIVMFDLSDSRGRSRLYAAFGLFFGPVLSMIAALLDPAFSEGPDGGPGYLDQVASAPVLHEVAGLINLVSVLLLIVGLVGAIRLLRGPRGAIGRIGAGLLLVASVVLEAGTFVTSAIDAAAVSPGVARPQALALTAAASGGVVDLVFAIAFFGGFLLGSLLLAVGLIRRRAVPIWAAVLVAVQLVISFLAPDNLIDALADLVLAVGFGAVAWTILSLSNEQWGAWQPLPDRAASAEGSSARPSETRGSALA
jgi:hypothetical protein